MEFQWFQAIFLEIQDEVSFQKIGAGNLANDILVLLTAEEGLKTVKPWDFRNPSLSTEVFDVGKTSAVKAEDAFASLSG
jgi:hypothetical protein